MKITDPEKRGPLLRMVDLFVRESEHSSLVNADIETLMLKVQPMSYKTCKIWSNALSRLAVSEAQFILGLFTGWK